MTQTTKTTEVYLIMYLGVDHYKTTNDKKYLLKMIKFLDTYNHVCEDDKKIDLYKELIVAMAKDYLEECLNDILESMNTEPELYDYDNQLINDFKELKSAIDDYDKDAEDEINSFTEELNKKFINILDNKCNHYMLQEIKTKMSKYQLLNHTVLYKDQGKIAKKDMFKFLSGSSIREQFRLKNN